MTLAQYYRPSFFREVHGQAIFVRLLTQGLIQNRLGHGFLLTGMRGIGKTTLARLLAKALACGHRQGQAEPCGTCPSCQALAADAHLDVLEMDAASHTSVEDIRPLLETCSYKPVMGLCRVFIIDEVHMLSKSAFNALLKTLEEPPAHVKFIFATTEGHKVPSTIVSRCHHLPLKRLSEDHVMAFLAMVCDKEGYRIEKEALALLAGYSQGSMRDALSLLEQAMVMEKEKNINFASIREILGLPLEEEIKALLQAMVSKDQERVISLSKGLYEKGIEPDSLLKELLKEIHHQAFHKDPSSLEILDRLFQMAHKARPDVLSSPFPFLALNMLFMRMTYVGHFPSPGEVLSFLDSASPPKNSPSSPPNHSPASPQKTLPSSPPVIPPPSPACAPSFQDFLLALQKKREILLYTHLTRDVSFVSWNHTLLLLCWVSSSPLPPSLGSSLEKFLFSWTGKNHTIQWENQVGEPTWHHHQEEVKKNLYEKALNSPLVKKAKEAFPDLIIEEIEPL